MFDRELFEREKSHLIERLSSDSALNDLGNAFVNDSNKLKYAYIWNWLGLPIIQMPEDIIKVQEVIFEAKPDDIIETGVAWGGSLLFYASILESIGHGQIIGIDITIPEHNRDIIMSSLGNNRITLLEGSSISPDIFKKVTEFLPKKSKVLLILDSHHTSEHVTAELNLWSPLVTSGSYIIVCDTIVEFIDAPADRVRPWGKGDNPFTSVLKFFGENERFTLENEYNKKSLTSFHPNGFLLAND